MLYYCQTEEGNFGDDLNPWLWSRLAPEVCAPAPSPLFIGVGTLLSCSVPAPPLKVVFGAGCGYKRPPVLDDHWLFYAVRGPLTAAALGLDASLAISDPALLVRGTGRAPRAKRYAAAFMPHHKSLQHADWESLCARAGLRLIDPRQPVETVIADIQESELLLAEAMHGAIVADALRVPWIPLRMYHRFLEFKWRDWLQSLDLPWNVADVPPVYERALPWQTKAVHWWKAGWGDSGLGKEKWKRLQVGVTTEPEKEAVVQALGEVARHHRPNLSTDTRLSEAEEKLTAQLARLRARWPRFVA